MPKLFSIFGRQFDLTLPAETLETLIPHVQVTSNEPDLVSFLSKLDWGVKMLASLMPVAVSPLKTSKMPLATACTMSNCVSLRVIWR